MTVYRYKPNRSNVDITATILYDDNDGVYFQRWADGEPNGRGALSQSEFLFYYEPIPDRTVLRVVIEGGLEPHRHLDRTVENALHDYLRKDFSITVTREEEKP